MQGQACQEGSKCTGHCYGCQHAISQILTPGNLCFRQPLQELPHHHCLRKLLLPSGWVPIWIWLPEVVPSIWTSLVYSLHRTLLSVYLMTINSPVIHLEYCFAHGKYPVSDDWIDSFYMLFVCMVCWVWVCSWPSMHSWVGGWLSGDGSPLPTRVSGIKLMLPGFYGKCFHTLSHLANPNSGDLVFMKIMSAQQKAHFFGTIWENCLRFHSIPNSHPSIYT